MIILLSLLFQSFSLSLTFPSGQAQVPHPSKNVSSTLIPTHHLIVHTDLFVYHTSWKQGSMYSWPHSYLPVYMSVGCAGFSLVGARSSHCGGFS